MSFLTVPENILFKTLKSILSFLRSDLEQNQLTPTETYLYKLCSGETPAEGRLDYFKSAQKIFTYNVDDPKYLEVTLMYNLQSVKPNTINVSHAGESSMLLALGQDASSENIYKNTDGTYQLIYGRRYTASYSLGIVTDNTNDSIIIYHVIKSILIALESHLSFLGLANIKIGGQDIRLESEHVPPSMNAKVMTIGCEYMEYALQMDKQEVALGIIYNGIIDTE